MMKRNLLIALISLILVTAVSAILIHLWLHRDPPPSVIAAENALATEDLFAIGHFNNSRLTTILDLISGEDDPEPFVMPGIEATLWNDLYRGTVSLRDNADQIIFGVKGDAKTRTGATAMLLSGAFDWNSLQSALRTYFEIHSLGQGYYRLKAIQKPTDVRVCPDDEKKAEKQSRLVWLHVSPNWLIGTNEEGYLKQLQQRMSQQAPPRLDLTRWRDYRKSKLASVGILVPESAGSSPGISGFVLHGASKSNPEITGVFLGSSISYQTAGISLNLQVDSSSAQWISEKQSKVATLLSEATREAGAFSPTLVELLSGISVGTDDNALDLNADIRLDTVKKLPDMIKESFGAMFSMGSGSSKQAPEKESINESPWDFSVNQRLVKLPDFTAGQFGSTPVWNKGPLGIDISSIRLGEQSQLLELQVESRLQIIEVKDLNWWDSKAEMKLYIESVTDTSGKEMLRDELCIKDLPRFSKKNREPEVGFNVFQQQSKLSKTIRLNKGSRYDTIQKIKGHVTLTAPIQVKRVPLEFRKGASAEHAGLRFYISATGQQDISYRLSGDTDKLVEIRAFNKSGKALNHSSSFSGGGSGNQTYRGDIHGIEIYVAEKKLEKRFDFELDASRMLEHMSTKNTSAVQAPYAPNVVSISDWQKLEKLNMDDFDPKAERQSYYGGKHTVAHWLQAPISMVVDHDSQSSWKTSPTFEFLLPMLDAMAMNLGAVELQVKQSEMAQAMATDRLKIRQGYSYRDDTFIKFIPAKTYKDVDFTSTSTSIDIGLEEQQKINSLSGKVIVRLPQSVQHTKLAPPGFDMTVEVEDLKVELKEITRGQIPRLKYEISGNLDHFINLVAITSSGERIFPEQSDFDKGIWVIQYDLRNDIEQLELIHALEVSTVEYSFDLKATYPQ